MNVERIPLEDPEWSGFVSSHDDATPFHLPVWARLLADCYGFEAFVLAVHDADGTLAAGAPVIEVTSPTGRTRWVSLPFSDSCPPLVRDGILLDEVAQALTGFVLGSRTDGLEIRAILPGADHRFPAEVGYNYLLALPGSAESLHPSKGHRQNRNLAVRSGVQLRRGTGTESVDEFYRLHTLTRRRQGVPVQPRKFFDFIADRMLSAGHGFITTATLDDEVVAAGLFLTHNRTIVAKFRASDRAGQASGAGFLVDWDALAGACDDGYLTMDLGRTDSDEAGQRRYKTGWGAIETPLIYTRVAEEAPASARASVGGLSRSVIRHSPLWVTRGLGEILYRWTA
jgi:CelD/BcsL family acetyltransferase involved in cellulose biosynthesis